MAQPEGGYRFSLDPLLLASFAAPKHGARVLDLGTGCGAAGLALLLRNPDMDLRLAGLDIDPEMISAAKENGRRLGFDAAFETVCGDVRDIRTIPEIGPESHDLILCNPPYRDPGSGRLAPEEGRLRARFETEGAMEDFISAAAYALANKGRFALVILAGRLVSVMAALAERKLEPKRLRLVHSRHNEPARLALLESLKNGAPDLNVEPPLVLYEGEGEASRLTQAALSFCPFLSCNPGAQEQSGARYSSSCPR